MSSIFEWCRRITPAHAGKRTSINSRYISTRDHPRTRGEKPHKRGSLRREEGSPPHTRGKAFNGSKKSRYPRITPAHAGKSPINGVLFGKKRDHPRTRGEKTKAEELTGAGVGSPPHTRGKGGLISLSSTFDGITPAHAGKSNSTG